MLLTPAPSLSLQFIVCLVTAGTEDEEHERLKAAPQTERKQGQELATSRGIVMGRGQETVALCPASPAALLS